MNLILNEGKDRSGIAFSSTWRKYSVYASFEFSKLRLIMWSIISISCGDHRALKPPERCLLSVFTIFLPRWSLQWDRFLVLHLIPCPHYQKIFHRVLNLSRDKSLTPKVLSVSIHAIASTDSVLILTERKRIAPETFGGVEYNLKTVIPICYEVNSSLGPWFPSSRSLRSSKRPAKKLKLNEKKIH